MLSDDPAVFTAPFRTARIGTMRALPVDRREIRFDNEKLKFSIKLKSSPDADVKKIKVPVDHITLLKSFMGRGCPIICVKTSTEYAAMLRDKVGMKQGSIPSPYYDPESKVQAETQIALVLDMDPIPYTASYLFKKVLNEICQKLKATEEEMHVPLNHAQSNALLVEISGVCDKIVSLNEKEAPKTKSFGILQDSSSLLRMEVIPDEQSVDISPALPVMETDEISSEITETQVAKTAKGSTAKTAKAKITKAQKTPSLNSPKSPATKVTKNVNRARKTVPKSDNTLSLEMQLSEIRAKARLDPDQDILEIVTLKGAQIPSPNNLAKGSAGKNDFDFSLKKKSRNPPSNRPSPRVKTKKRLNSYGECDFVNKSSIPVAGDSLKIPFSTVSASMQSSSAVSDEQKIAASDGNGELNLTEKCLCLEKNDHIVVSGKEPAKCMGVDVVDSRLSRCIYSVKTTMMMRPSKNCPLLALCEEHRERMLRHECCPGCGMFCAGGHFLMCVDVTECPHRFHHECMVSRYETKCCLHCLAPMSKVREVDIEPRQDYKLRSVVARLDPNKMDRKKTRHKNARMGHKSPIVRDSIPGIIKTLGIFTIDTHNLPVGDARETLEDSLFKFSSESSEKVKKSINQIVQQGDLVKLMQFLDESTEQDLKLLQKTPSLFSKAVTRSDIPMVYLLACTIASVNGIDSKGKTALFYAEEQENVVLIDFLIESGADFTIKDSSGMMCIHHAAKNGRIVSCAALMRHSRDIVNLQDDGGWTPIVWAAEHSHITTARYLEHFGADMMKSDKEGNTCLHWAALSGNSDLIISCIQRCGEVNRQNYVGDTALHIAARQDHPECVLCLINWGTDLSIENKDKKTALQCAIADSDCEALLKLKVGLLSEMAKRSASPITQEKILCSDLSRGFENLPVSCVNSIDDVPHPCSGPDGFHYVIANVHTSSETIVKNPTNKMQSCYCYNECADGSCLCGVMSGRCWYNKSGHLIKEFDFVDAPYIVECSETCWCPASCHNRVVQKGIKYNLQVHRTTSMGWSVRTLDTIPRGAFVCEYVGELISDAEADIREDDSYLFDLENSDGEIFCIDARYYGNVSRFINHLCDPNLMPLRVFIDHHDKRFPRLAYFSTKEISAGEELGFDYGDRFWDVKCRSFTCGCGSSQCKYSAEAYRLKREEEIAKSNSEVAVPSI